MTYVTLIVYLIFYTMSHVISWFCCLAYSQMTDYFRYNYFIHLLLGWGCHCMRVCVCVCLCVCVCVSVCVCTRTRAGFFLSLDIYIIDHYLYWLES